MQAQIDEAIGLAKKTMRTMPHIEHKADENDCYCLINQLLTKLRSIKEPEPTEFTKNIMANLERWDSVLSIQEDIRIKTIIDWLKEVCRRYDWLVKRNAKLQSEIKNLKGK